MVANVNETVALLNPALTQHSLALAFSFSFSCCYTRILKFLTCFDWFISMHKWLNCLHFIHLIGFCHLPLASCRSDTFERLYNVLPLSASLNVLDVQASAKQVRQLPVFSYLVVGRSKANLKNQKNKQTKKCDMYIFSLGWNYSLSLSAQPVNADGCTPRARFCCQVSAF